MRRKRWRGRGGGGFRGKFAREERVMRKELRKKVGVLIVCKEVEAREMENRGE